MNRVLVARNDGVEWRILPRAQTFEAEFFFVIDKSGGNVRGEKLRRDLTDHESSLVQIHAEASKDGTGRTGRLGNFGASTAESLIAGFARCVVLLPVSPKIIKDANEVAI